MARLLGDGLVLPGHEHRLFDGRVARPRGRTSELKTWSQAVAAAVGGLAAAGAWSDSVAWWALLVALVLTWVSGLDYARVAP